jgi:hypothetical protein
MNSGPLQFSHSDIVRASRGTASVSTGRIDLIITRLKHLKVFGPSTCFVSEITERISMKFVTSIV